MKKKFKKQKKNLLKVKQESYLNPEILETISKGNEIYERQRQKLLVAYWH